MSDLDDLPEQRARVRACGKFILQADVARFYPSVYTHSIPWVLHGKATAKKKKFDPSMVGNELDLLLRNCQDQQTMGIPVGPDTSLVIAELILSHVDRALTKKSITGIRYVDDFELVFATEDLALRARTALQGCLGEMELNLGPAKTRIARLPLALRDPWVAELRKFPLNVYRVNHRKLLLAFFDKAFELSTQYPDKGVLKYTAGCISKLRLEPRDARLAENLLMQCARVEAGALAYALSSLLSYRAEDDKHQNVRRAFLIDIIQEHAPQKHSSEVAWAIWAMIVLNLKTPSKIASLVAKMNDPCCTLLALHSRELGLMDNIQEFDALRLELSPESLYDSNWLLTYEASRKGWFRFRKGGDFVLKDPNFGPMRKAKVSFYDKAKTILHSSQAADPFADDSLSQEVAAYISRIARTYDEDDWWTFDEDQSDD